MKILLSLLVWLSLAAACADQGVELRGTLADGWTGGALFVSVEGAPERVEVRQNAFALDGLPAGPVRLRIQEEDGEAARVDIHDLPAGASLSLQRIRLREGRELAFPSAVRIRGAELVTINGIRMADPGALPRRVEAEGEVLAVRDQGDALIVRPRSDDLPDLPVVVTPATRVTDHSGEDVSPERVSVGDSVLVKGPTEAGYLLAEHIRLADSPPGRSRGRAAEEPEPRPRAREIREPREAPDEQRRETRRGSERGRKDVPKGHRPPPGECRDWDPDLPPGRQPPPRKC